MTSCVSGHYYLLLEIQSERSYLYFSDLHHHQVFSNRFSGGGDIFKINNDFVAIILIFLLSLSFTTNGPNGVT